MSKLIADLLASQSRRRKQAVAQISLMHQVTSKSPEAADATEQTRSGSPRVFVVLLLLKAAVRGRLLI